MVAGVIGVLARGAVQQVALAFPVQAGAVRILDVAGQGCLPVAGVLRDTEHLERGSLPTLTAIKGFDGHSRVGVQFVGTVERLDPVFRRVMVVVLLGGKGRGNKGEHDSHNQKQGHQPPGGMVMNLQFAPPNNHHVEMEKAPGTMCPKGSLLQFRLLLRRLLFLPLVQQGHDLLLHLPGRDFLAEILVQFVRADNHLTDLLLLFT